MARDLRASSRDPEATAALLLATLDETEKQISAGESGLTASYNYQAARLMERLAEAKLGPWSGNTVVSGPPGTFRITWEDPSGILAPNRAIVATDSLSFTGSEAGPPATREGLGAPIIVEPPRPLDFAEYNLNKHHFTDRYRTATAIVMVRGNTATIRLLDPYSAETVAFAGRTRPLAADFTTVASRSVARDRTDKLGFARLINPDRYAATAALSMVQPYDPARIPVLMVHGLDSTAATWLTLYRELMRDPEIRRNYQFWFFSYPSGYPYPYSASLLRKELARVRSQHPDQKDLVIIGHSMGGVISRLVLLDPGERIWKSYFGTTPDKTALTGMSRQLLEEAFIFDPVPHVSRAIFISSPHRGSEIASNWIGRLSSRLVRPPALLADIRDSVVNILTVDDAAMHLNRAANSIDTLAPNDRFVRVTKELPVANGVPYHSIMGNRGKPGPKEESSDGVVPYWSSHLDGARSEQLVPSGHGAHRHPQGVEEVHRILRLHLRK